MNELSLADQQRLDAELEKGFHDWKEKQTLEQLDDLGITWTFIPVQSATNLNTAHRRDYPKPGIFTEEQFHRLVRGVCAVGIIITCAVLIWSELR